MRDHRVAYDGSVILAAEVLQYNTKYNRIVPALPPRGAAGGVLALDLCDSGLVSLLSDPYRCLLPE
eukprot:5749762-Amphidinium_carterae.1